ncbi:hypothetical protein [Vibrio sp. THAF190c]|uniref:hypothetical protein n=1 Tax=Vibrio sp. THAF190c TaxID=2587865 RepID=UPI0012681ABB|nr:hypothetical protein [Vibrio sp. THAF190c]QFT12977.1 hypothetical protein FIV04_23840 [Vibrio sp. THAF190c]
MHVNPQNKRKALTPSKKILNHSAQVKKLHVDDMVLKYNSNRFIYFKRLKYKGCPKLKFSTAEFPTGTKLIDMQRDDFIREFYEYLGSSESINIHQMYFGLVTYLRYLDQNFESLKDDYLEFDLIESFIEWGITQVELGKISNNRIRVAKGTLTWLLVKRNRKHELNRLPAIRRNRDYIKGAKALDLENELKPVARALFKGYKVLLLHFNQGTTPKVHPLYDEKLVDIEAKARGLSKRSTIVAHKAFQQALRGDYGLEQCLIRLAIMITFMFTGMNSKPLYDLKISDLSFREVQGGKYILNSVKGRANYQKQDNSLGFSKYAKEFIESWVLVAKKFSEGMGDGYLFPHIDDLGEMSSYSYKSHQPHKSINRMLQRLGLVTITPSVLRKTKSDALYRVTESVYLVAMSNNNTMAVTARTYINGTEKEHENNLSAAMSAQFSMTKGIDVIDAVKEAKFNHGEILDDYEYQRLRRGKDRAHEARTATGIRCTDNRKGATSLIQQSLNKVGIDTRKGEQVCTDFLECFKCEQHAFVTDVEDIWLMLSFKETLQQLQQTPAINSMPEDKYINLFNQVDSVLNGYKIKNKTNYNIAMEKIKHAPHPLYSTAYSLNDLLEVFT